MKFNYILYVVLFAMHGLHGMQQNNQLIHRNYPGAGFVMQDAHDMHHVVQPCHVSKAQRKDFFDEVYSFKVGSCIVLTGQLLHFCNSQPMVRDIAVRTVGACCDCSQGGEECDRWMTVVPWGLQFCGLLVAGSSYNRMKEIRHSIHFGSGMIFE